MLYISTNYVQGNDNSFISISQNGGLTFLQPPYDFFFNILGRVSVQILRCPIHWCTNDVQEDGIKCESFFEKGGPFAKILNYKNLQKF